MSAQPLAQQLQNFRKRLPSFSSEREALRALSQHIADVLGVDHVWMWTREGLSLLDRTNVFASGRKFREWLSGQEIGAEELSVQYDAGRFFCEGEEIEVPLFIADLQQSSMPTALRDRLLRRGARTYALLPVYEADTCIGCIEIFHQSISHEWTEEEKSYLAEVADLLSMLAAQWGSRQEKHSRREHKLREGSHVPRVYDREEFLDSTEVNPATQVNPAIQVNPAMQVTPAMQWQTLADPEAHIHSGHIAYGAHFNKLAEFGGLLVIRTDAEFRITDVLGNTRDLLGMSREELLHHEDVWSQFMVSSDLRRLARKVRRMRTRPQELSEELRVIHRGNRRVSWIALRAIPVFDQKGIFCGWEGFGFDISMKLHIQSELWSQNKRMRALYEVARALQASSSPEQLALAGLQVLLQATSAHAGFVCFAQEDGRRFEVVASQALQEAFLQGLEHQATERGSLVQSVIDSGKAMVLSDLQNDERIPGHLARSERLHSGLFVPLRAGVKTFGSMALLRRTQHAFTKADLELVGAAASQISLAIEQAQHVLEDKQLSDAIAVLYQLSHRISRLGTTPEIIEQAFPIILQELACKRIWLGVLNEQGTHIVGQGGIGPGIRGRIKEIQIEVARRHDFLDEALRTGRPVYVRKGSPMECSGLTSVIERLHVGDFLIVPLVSLGKTIGVLVLEPTVASPSFLRRKVSLVTSMANEIAMMILARRFETKVADADKMRMAGLFASGIAHNFNNILQAIMGQASLIQSQSTQSPLLQESSRTIVDVATRGALLIRQLLSFSQQESLDMKDVHVEELLFSSEDLYRSAVGENVQLDISVDNQLSPVMADMSQLQQVLLNLLFNARDAVEGIERPEVHIRARSVHLHSGEIDPELPPGDYIRIDIEDNGVGMSEERQARCFEPFYTTKSVDAGTGLGLTGSGLGLSSSYSIVRKHKGTVLVSSQEGEGSEFSIFLPVYEHFSQSLLHEEGERVVIVGVEDSVARSLQSTLNSLGLRSRVQRNTESSVARIQENPRIELLILDADRSDDNVEDLVRAVRSIKPQMKIVLTTIDRRRWLTLAGEEGSGLTIAEKPIGVWSIQSLVRDLLAIGASRSLQEQIEIIRNDRFSVEEGSSGAHLGAVAPRGRILRRSE